MKEISYTLLADGSSDRALMPIIDWTLREQLTAIAIEKSWADLSKLPQPPKLLDQRIRKATALYPADIIFIHRDCEKQSWEIRKQEVDDAWKEVSHMCKSQAVCILPVKMTEAWLLVNEEAIRKASGNPNGKVHLNLPGTSKLESIPDPKEILKELLRTASGLKGRRLEKFNDSKAVHLVSDNIDDFSILRNLKSFSQFEEELKNTLTLIFEQQE